MDFFNVVNAGLVGAIIVLIETVKQLLKEIWKLEPPVWVWKVAVILMGIPAALLAGSYENARGFVTSVFLYSAAATLLYQTGKLTLSALLNRNEKMD